MHSSNLYASQKTSRTVTEIQADSDKIPVHSKTPIPVEDNSDEIHKMLIDSITSPAEQESDARFYTPEFTPAHFLNRGSPNETQKKLCRDGFNDFMPRLVFRLQ